MSKPIIHQMRQDNLNIHPYCVCDETPCPPTMSLSKMSLGKLKGPFNRATFFVYKATNGRLYTYMPEFVTCEQCIARQSSNETR